MNGEVCLTGDEFDFTLFIIVWKDSTRLEDSPLQPTSQSAWRNEWDGVGVIGIHSPTHITYEIKKNKNTSSALENSEIIVNFRRVLGI